MTDSTTDAETDESDNEKDRQYVPDEFENAEFQEGWTLQKVYDMFLFLSIATIVSASIGALAHYVLGNAWGVGSFACISLFFVAAQIVTCSLGWTRFSYRLLWNIRYLGSKFTRLIYRQSTIVFLILVALAPGIVYNQTESPELTGLATVFYATVLVLKEILLGESALLKFYPEKTNYERDSEDNYLTYTCLLQNIGSDEASAVTITYRAFNAQGKPLTDPKKVDLPAEYLSLEVGNRIPADQIFAPISMKVSEETQGTLRIHLKADDGISFSLIPTRTRLTTPFGE